jgi:hypothetical protein
MWKPNRIAASRIAHRIVIGSVLVVLACEPPQSSDVPLSPDMDAAIGLDLALSEPGRVAGAAIQHVHEELIRAHPQLGSSEVVFDPTFPVGGGREWSHPTSVTDELARSLELRLDSRTSVLQCSEQEPRQCRIEGAAILMRMGEVSIRGHEASVVVEVTYEIEGVRPSAVYSAWQELILHREAGTWRVTGVRVRGVT